MNAPSDLSMKTDEVLRVELEVFRREHRDLDDAIHALVEKGTSHQLTIQRLKKRKLRKGSVCGDIAIQGKAVGRVSGKIKAWFQGSALISHMAIPAFLGMADWNLTYAAAFAWVCAALSAGSMIEYIWVNRTTLAALVERRQR